jgi:hypothetical protein
VRRFGPVRFARLPLQPRLKVGHAIANRLARQDDGRREVATGAQLENRPAPDAEQFGRTGCINK